MRPQITFTLFSRRQDGERVVAIGMNLARKSVMCSAIVCAPSPIGWNPDSGSVISTPMVPGKRAAAHATHSSLLRGPGA